MTIFSFPYFSTTKAKCIYLNYYCRESAQKYKSFETQNIKFGTGVQKLYPFEFAQFFIFGQVGRLEALLAV